MFVVIALMHIVVDVVVVNVEATASS